MNEPEIALALVSVLCSTAGQVAFKAAANRDFFRAMPFWSCGMSLMLASVLVAATVLRTAPLSGLVPFAGLAYVATPFAAMIVFKESVNKRFWQGALLIVAGVVLTLA
jgi:multidrug transporter EmrE-like cation transporter